MIGFLTVSFCFTIAVGILAFLSLTEIPAGRTERAADTRRIMPGAESFELTAGGSAAVLLVHGFTGSAFEMRDLAEKLHRAGFDVRCPLLPGHGTAEKDLNSTRFAGWYDAVRSSYLDLRKQYGKVFVAGMSMGGTLSLKLAEEFGGTPDEPSGLAVCSSPVQFNGFMNGTLYVKDRRLFLTGIIGRFLPLLPKPPADEPVDLVFTVGYRNYHPVRALHSFKLGMKKVKRDIGRVTAPICIQHARLDGEIGYENAEFICRNVSSAVRELHTIEFPASDPTRKHVLIRHVTVKDEVTERITDFFSTLMKKSVPDV